MDNEFRAEQVCSSLLTETSLKVEQGQCLCITGPSGSGKSLLLRSLADLDLHNGQVWLGEKECHSFKPSEWRRTVAYIPAESQWWAESVGEHFPVETDDMSARLGFPADVMQWQIARLSTGEKQRLGLLRALQFNPRVLLLDEPTANMDEENTAKVEELVLEYMREHNVCVIWVSHSRDQVERIADAHVEMGEEAAA